MAIFHLLLKVIRTLQGGLLCFAPEITLEDKIGRIGDKSEQILGFWVCVRFVKINRTRAVPEGMARGDGSDMGLDDRMVLTQFAAKSV